MAHDYPWYDSRWLTSFTQARAVVARVRPQALAGFVGAFDVFRTDPGYEVATLASVFDPEVLAEIEQLAASLSPTELEYHEAKSFGRFVVHNHPRLTELHDNVLDVASEAAGELLEPAYNFLSLYTGAGVCPVHMDAPYSKWTLDVCVRQSREWPIHISNVVPWPERAPEGPDWERAIREDPAHSFRAYSLTPNTAVLFSGSSQWHYRDRHPGQGGDEYCDLLFFHFIPKGTAELVEPANWARLFDLPELADA